jgi:hypothetical protein
MNEQLFIQWLKRLPRVGTDLNRAQNKLAAEGPAQPPIASRRKKAVLLSVLLGLQRQN